MRFAAIIATLFLLAACVADDPRNEGVSVGDPLPPFEVTLASGSVEGSASLRGRVAVIIFFSTTCGDCRRELPELEGVWRHFEDDPEVAFLAISREETPGRVEAFWEELHLSIPFSAQPDRRVYNLFATVGVPRVYIADRSSTVVAAYGDSDLPDPDRLTAVITACIGSGHAL